MVAVAGVVLNCGGIGGNDASHSGGGSGANCGGGGNGGKGYVRLGRRLM